MRFGVVTRILLAALFAVCLNLVSARAQECILPDSRLAFCHGDDWSPRQSKNPDIVAAYRGGLTFRLSFILGDAGTDSGDTPESILEFQRDTYAEYAGHKLADLPVLSNEAVEVSGISGQRQVFSVVINGRNYVVAVSVFVLPDQNLQVITLEEKRRYTSRHRGRHDEALAELQYDPDAGSAQ